MLALVLFTGAAYGLANAFTLKIGRFFFGEALCDKEGCTASNHPLEKRKGLGRIPYLGEIFYCPPCLAMWIGVGLSLLFFSPTMLAVEHPALAGTAFSSIRHPAQAALVDGLFASGTTWFIHVLAEKNADGLDL